MFAHPNMVYGGSAPIHNSPTFPLNTGAIPERTGGVPTRPVAANYVLPPGGSSGGMIMPECTNGPPGIGMGIGPMTGQMPMGMHPGIMGMGIPPIGIGGMPPPMGGMAPGMPRMGGISGMGMNGMGGMGGIAPGVGGMWMTPYFERSQGPGWPQMSWGASPQEMNVPWGGQSGSFGPRGFGESRELEEEPGSPSTPVPRHRGHPELIVKRREAQQYRPPGSLRYPRQHAPSTNANTPATSTATSPEKASYSHNGMGDPGDSYFPYIQGSLPGLHKANAEHYPYDAYSGPFGRGEGSQAHSETHSGSGSMSYEPQTRQAQRGRSWYG